MGITTSQIDGITGGNVVSTDGDKIGGIGQVYLDDNTGEPNWVTVKTGLFGTSESFVPLDGADLRGGDIVVKYDKATIKDAPRVDADGSITPEEEETLYSYYGLGGSNAGYTPTPTTPRLDTEPRRRARPTPITRRRAPPTSMTGPVAPRATTFLVRRPTTR